MKTNQKQYLVAAAGGAILGMAFLSVVEVLMQRASEMLLDITVETLAGMAEGA